MTDSQRWRQIDVPNYAEIKWLLHRLIEVMKAAGILGDLDGLADGFSA
jgi:hypothetical protein